MPETAFSAYRGRVITTTNPTTGETRETGIEATPDAAVAAAAELAAAAAPALATADREWRAGLLDALAAGLDADAPLLVETAMAETGLPRPRLETEVIRSAFQFRLFAEAVREGSFLEAAIDHAAPTPMGPGPDLRRMLVALGPVAVFGSSNFPFAFSVVGGDTASALAAGCPVVVKAHSSHPLTSQTSFATLQRAAEAYGAPAGTLGIVYGTAAGRALVADPHIAAVGFTGSLGAAQALLTIIDARPEPIPFYGELSSVNPLVVTPGAAAARGEQLGEGLFTSFSGSAGQLCTKPGVAFVPRSATTLVDTLVARVEAAGPQPLLNSRILTSFGEIRDRLVAEGRAEVLATGSAGDGHPEGFGVVPHVLRIDAADLTEAATEEAFGPLVLLAVYDDLDEVLTGLREVPTSLTATLHSEPGESAERALLVEAMQRRAGRLVFDGYPTGVRVAWAQHHGGPWPATNTIHTSVGVTAMRRFLRPFAWQDAPADVLPRELHDDDRSVPRRVDGVLQLPA